MDYGDRFRNATDEQLMALGVLGLAVGLCAVAVVPSITVGLALGALGGRVGGRQLLARGWRAGIVLSLGVVGLGCVGWAALTGPLEGAVSEWWREWSPVLPTPRFASALGHVPVLATLGLASVPLGVGFGMRSAAKVCAARGQVPASRKERREVDREVTIGRLAEGGPYGLAREQLRQHVLCVGASGAGKTTLVGHVLVGVQARGVGALVVDLKGDRGLESVARSVDPGIQVFRIDGDSGWDPLVTGDPTSVRDMVMGVETFTEPHYRRAGERFLALVADAMVRSGETLRLSTLAAALERPPAAARRLGGQLAREGVDEQTQQVGRRLGEVADLLESDRSLLSGIVGLGNRLGVLVDSPSIGPRLGALGAEADVVSLDHALVDGGITLFSLDAAVYASEGPALAALVLASAHARASRLGRRDGLGCLLVIDEAAQLPDAGRALPRLIQMGRSVGLGTFIGTQSISDLARLGALEEIWESCATKLVMRQDVPSSAQWVSDSIGTRTVTKSTRKFDHEHLLRRPTGEESERDVEEYMVHPNSIRGLRTGEVVAVERWPRSAARRIRVERFEGL